jgi:pantoate--beta-alanine ligase
MEVFHTIQEIRGFVSSERNSGKTIGLVPTMGALHPGHITIVEQAVKENDTVVASIFVNPIQFNNPEDLAKYPRTMESDLQKLERAGCSAVFSPSVEEMYPVPDTTVFNFGKLDKVMEGKFRPGHFRGVGIVVKKLFEIVQPDKAYFGEKDFQQVAIIRHMTQTFHLPVQVISCSIVREADGLAMSSRNMRLTEAERAVAPQIYRALMKARENYSWFTPDGLPLIIRAEIEQNTLFRVEYAEVVDTETLQRFDDWPDAEHAVVCVAVFLGSVRLIDNIVLY